MEGGEGSGGAERGGEEGGGEGEGGRTFCFRCSVWAHGSSGISNHKSPIAFYECDDSYKYPVPTITFGDSFR